MKNAAVLCNTTVLRQLLSEWIQLLFAAAESCDELNKTEEPSSLQKSQTNLKTFLEESAVENVSFLAGMCFDLSIYGPYAGQTTSASQDNQCECHSSHKPRRQGDVEGDALIQQDHEMPCDLNDSIAPQSVNSSSSTNINIDCTGSHGDCDLWTNNPAGCGASVENREEEFTVGETDLRVPSLNPAGPCVRPEEQREYVSLSQTLDEQANRTNNVECPEVTCVNGPVSVAPSSEDHYSPKVLMKEATRRHSSNDSSFLLKQNENIDTECSVLSLQSECSTSSNFCQTKVNSSKIVVTEWRCPVCDKIFDQEFVHASQSARDRDLLEQQRDLQNDQERAMFVLRNFYLLSVKQLRRTLKMSPGCRKNTCRVILNCLQS